MGKRLDYRKYLASLATIVSLLQGVTVNGQSDGGSAFSGLTLSSLAAPPQSRSRRTIAHEAPTVTRTSSLTAPRLAAPVPQTSHANAAPRSPAKRLIQQRVPGAKIVAQGSPTPAPNYNCFFVGGWNCHEYLGRSAVLSYVDKFGDITDSSPYYYCFGPLGYPVLPGYTFSGGNGTGTCTWYSNLTVAIAFNYVTGGVGIGCTCYYSYNYITGGQQYVDHFHTIFSGVITVSPFPERFCGTCALTAVNHPIDIATGELWNEKTDLSLSGPFGLKFARFYGNQTQGSADLGGTRWLHSYSARLDLSGGSSVV